MDTNLVDRMPTADAIAALSDLSAIPLSEAALFLDLDGTLASFRDVPWEVGPDPRRTALLRALNETLQGRLAVISGRSLEDVDRIVEAACVSVAGTHGLERRRATGLVVACEPHSELARTKAAVTAFAAARPALTVEEKPLSIVLHYRTAPGMEDEVRAFAGTVAAETGLKLQLGDRMAELRTPGANKGDAIRAFMTEPPFAGASPIFVGDDVTDEDGFVAADELGGIGVLVGPPRSTRAVARLPDVSSVLDWLDRSIASGVFRVEYRA